MIIITAILVSALMAGSRDVPAATQAGDPRILPLEVVGESSATPDRPAGSDSSAPPSTGRPANKDGQANQAAAPATPPAPPRAATPTQGRTSPPATPPARPMRNAVLVVGFENTSEDRSLYWVGEAISDGLAREIRLAGGETIDRRERMSVRDEMGVPALSTLTLASQIHIAEELGAPALVTGSFGSSGETLTVRVRVVNIATARTGPWLTVTGSVKSIIALQKDLFSKVRSALPSFRRTASRSVPAEDGVPQAAYELLLRTYYEDAPDKRERMLRRTLELAPDYLRAKMELAQIYRESNQLAKGAETLSTIVTRDPGLASEAETLLAEIHLEMGRAGEAEAAVRRALNVRESARAHLVLAKLAAARGDRALASAEARRSRALDPSDPEILEVEESLSKMQ